MILDFSNIFDCNYIVYDIYSFYKGEREMIDYTPFWDTLKRQHESWYTMTRNHNVSFSTLHRLKHNMDISTKTLNDLCRKLDCKVEDIVRYIPSDTDQIL